MSPLGITSGVGHADPLETCRVEIAGVAATMLDEDRVARDSGIEIRARDRPRLARLRVVILESEDPFARWGRRRALPERGQHVGDRAQIAIDPRQMSDAGVGWMRMRVDEARNHRLPGEVDARGFPGGEGENLV